MSNKKIWMNKTSTWQVKNVKRSSCNPACKGRGIRTSSPSHSRKETLKRMEKCGQSPLPDKLFYSIWQDQIINYLDIKSQKDQHVVAVTDTSQKLIKPIKQNIISK